MAGGNKYQTYVVERTGATVGAKSGSYIAYRAGVPIRVVEGDLKHLGKIVSVHKEQEADDTDK